MLDFEENLDEKARYQRSPLYKAVVAWHQHLSAHDVVRLVDSLNSCPMDTVGTICTGSGIEFKVYKCFQIYWLETFDMKVDILHQFSAERDKAKQKFIIREHPDLLVLMEEASSCSKVSAENKITEATVCVPSVRKLTAGFSCTSKSLLNVGRAANIACVQKGEGSTGLTFSAVAETIEAIGPEEVILENLKQMAAKDEGQDVSDKEWVVAWFKEHGYDAAWFEVEAMHFGSLANRFRLFLVAFKVVPGSCTERLSQW